MKSRVKANHNLKGMHASMFLEEIYNTFDGRNPANHYINWLAGFLPSTVPFVLFSRFFCWKEENLQAKKNLTLTK